MSSQEVGGIVRAIVAAIGGIFAAKGYTDDQTVALIAGSAATIGAAVWSVISKRRRA